VSISTPAVRALRVLEENDGFMGSTEEEGYVDTGEAFEQMHALRACIHELLMVPGTKVRMTAAGKTMLQANSDRVQRYRDDADHETLSNVEEFGDCIGIIAGPTDYTGSECQIKQLGPEVDVRWQPSNLRYAYLPEHLEIIQ